MAGDEARYRIPRRHLSRSDKDLLLHGTPVEQVLPIQRGRLRLGPVTPVCDCGDSIDPGCVRARVTEHGGAVTIIEIIGLCLECQKATPVVFRIRPAEARVEEWSPRYGWVFKELARRTRPRWWDLVAWMRRLKHYF